MRKGQIFKYARTAELYLCPVDRGVKAKMIGGNYGKKYALSYSMNFSLSWKIASNIRRQSRMLLFIHESRETINDGDFMWLDSALDMPSDVHYAGTTVVTWTAIPGGGAKHRGMERRQVKQGFCVSLYRLIGRSPLSVGSAHSYPPHYPLFSHNICRQPTQCGI